MAWDTDWARPSLIHRPDHMAPNEAYDWAYCCPKCDRRGVKDWPSFKKNTHMHREDCPWRTKEFLTRNKYEYLRNHVDGKRDDKVEFDRNNPDHVYPGKARQAREVRAVRPPPPSPPPPLI